VFQNQEITKNLKIIACVNFLLISALFISQLSQIKNSLGMLAGVNTQEQDQVGQVPL
jgi:hypothetical protein